MLTITTRYHGATDTRGSRVSATATVDNRRRSLRIPFDYAAGAYGTHEAAARALADRLRLRVYDACEGTRTGWRFLAEKVAA
jgi:protein gp37